MPNKPLKPCNRPRCPNLTTERFCLQHKSQAYRVDNANRGTAAQRGYDAQWRKARLRFLQQNPLCVECKKSGIFTAATVVDHIEPHKGDYLLFWDRKNWQPLCKMHHDRKTVEEDGGFGNTRVPMPKQP
ncbi:HNH endonuclease signature motif containing protein [Paenibacillus sp. 32352]|uniref:HNH endonuclease signature motif containing protein n=1 Tax=Paenibacillus sp. 32352 TaxID=1969111 RepID=UPI0009AC041B|nr:HNH endonuclease signature motif containing protein [Paenibacillus sp. 32352]